MSGYPQKTTFSMVQVEQIVGNLMTLQRTHTSQNGRRGLREAAAWSESLDKMERCVAELIVAMDFKFFEKLTEEQLRALIKSMKLMKFTSGE